MIIFNRIGETSLRLKRQCSNLRLKTQSSRDSPTNKTTNQITKQPTYQSINGVQWPGVNSLIWMHTLLSFNTTFCWIPHPKCMPCGCPEQEQTPPPPQFFSSFSFSEKITPHPLLLTQLPPEESPITKPTNCQSSTPELYAFSVFIFSSPSASISYPFSSYCLPSNLATLSSPIPCYSTFTHTLADDAVYAC